LYEDIMKKKMKIENGEFKKKIWIEERRKRGKKMELCVRREEK